MSTIDPSQLTAADLSNPALSAQDLADITAARPDLRPYVATHPSLYPALGQWLADQGVVPAQPPVADEPAVSESEVPAQEAGEQAEPFAGVHEEAQPEADAAPTEAPVEQPAVEEPHVEAPAESEVAHVEPEAPVAEASDDNLEKAILEGAAQSEAPAADEAAPAPSTEEQVAQSPFSNPPQADAQPQGQPQVGAQPQGQQAPFGQPQVGAQPQQGQQAPFGQPQYGTAPQQGQPQFGAQPQRGQQAPFGQPGQQGQQQFGGQPQRGQQAPFGQPGQQQYGQPGYAPAGQSAGQQFGAAAQQFGAAANSAFNQFQTAVVAETGKVSGRSVRATYSLIGIAASAVLILVSMFLPFVSAYGYSASMFEAKGGYSAFHLIMLMAVVGLGAAYWFTNQKWAYLSAGIGALVVALLGVIQFIVAISNKYVDASFGAFMLLLFSLALGAAGGLLLMELKTGAVAPINNPNAFGGAFAGAQFGQQQGGFQAPQGGQPQFGQQQGGFQAPQGGQPQFGQQQGGFQAPQAGQQQFGQQAPFGQQQGQQPQLGDKPYNPFGPQA